VGVEEFGDGDGQREDALLVFLAGDVEVGAASAFDPVGDVGSDHLGDASGEGVEEQDDERVELVLCRAHDGLHLVDFEDGGAAGGVALVDLGPVVLGDGVLGEVDLLGGVGVERGERVEVATDRGGRGAAAFHAEAPGADVVGGEAAEREPLVPEFLRVGAPDAADVVDVVAFGLEAAAPGGGQPVHDHDERLGGDGFGEEFGAGPVDALLAATVDLDHAEVVDELAADFLEQVRAGQRDRLPGGLLRHRSRGSRHRSRLQL
jgi:hypothetical protein